MRISRKLLAASAVAIAVLVPLAVLAQGWKGDNQKAQRGPAWIALGADAGSPQADSPYRCGRAYGGKAMGRVQWGGIGRLDTADVDEIAERLGLTDDEKAKLKELIDEAIPLRDELKGKMQEIHDLIAPKIQEKMQEKREECKDMAEEIKPIASDLRELYQQLKEAVQSDDETAQANIEDIKAQIEEKKEELKDKMEELRGSGCLCGKEFRERVKDRWQKAGDRVRNAVKNRCLSGLSDEDKDTLKSMMSEIREKKNELRDAVENGDEKVDELRDQLIKMVQDLRQFLQDKGVACGLIGRMPGRR